MTRWVFAENCVAIVFGELLFHEFLACGGIEFLFGCEDSGSVADGI